MYRTCVALLLAFVFAVAHAAPPACPQTAGTLTVNVSEPRSAGISPLFVWFDATGTTDTAATNSAFQDVNYTWNFSDSGASGSGVWQYGARSAYTSKNSATGGIAGHLYIVPDGSGDKTFTPIVTATDGTNTVTCSAPAVTVYDPAGANGFPTTSTTCVAAATLPVAGSGGCPAGAAVATQSNFGTAIGSYLGAGKRVLFKCGDTFTGPTSTTTISAIKWSIGAYGSCINTQSGRPIFSSTGFPSITDVIDVSQAAGDGRIADIDFEGDGTAGTTFGTVYSTSLVGYQVTLYNLLSNNNHGAYSTHWFSQFAMVGDVQSNVNTGWIGTFFNIAEWPTTPFSGNTFNNLSYQAIVDSYIAGPGFTGCTIGSAGVESARISAGDHMIFENSTFTNANCTAAVLKIHAGNFGSGCTWNGYYTQYVEVADNIFTGTSGGNLVETAPQANVCNTGGNLDERLRYITLERNVFDQTSSDTWGGRSLTVNASYESVRDNVVVMNVNGSQSYLQYGVQVGQLGAGGVNSTNVEIYNNTFYVPANAYGVSQDAIAFNAVGFYAAPTGCYAENNLFYSPGTTNTLIDNTGTGNTVSNNSTSSTANPSFTNVSGTLTQIYDFKPTANYSGGAAVPVVTDALGFPWSPTWDLGAVHH
ncbi:MAG: hypothetical protein KGL39_52430 [Patescibacteria group bacterium]|nr:hypothetical protein [Patescibacteria group bacterium]